MPPTAKSRMNILLALIFMEASIFCLPFDQSERISNKFIAGVAQLAEQLICNQQVAGSSPIASSMWWGSRVAKGNRL